MSRSSGNLPTASARRSQASPIAALVAVFAVLVGVGLYAGVLSDVGRDAGDRTAETTVETLRAAAADGDVVDPDRLREAASSPSATPAGFESNVTFGVDSGEGGDERSVWSVGPSPPDASLRADSSDRHDADVAVQRAERSVAVRVSPGKIRPGTLCVRVWR